MRVRRLIPIVVAGALLALVTAGAARAGLGGREAVAAEPAPSYVSLLNRRVLAGAGGDTLDLPTLRTSTGTPVGPAALRGRWALVFFGFTSCPDVCPTTMQLLTRVARDRRSGVQDGETLLLFVTVDPATDTPERMNAYLRHFDPRIFGLTGDSTALRRFSDAIGAAARKAGTQVDHSTSLFAIDPAGRLAGVLLNPADPERVVADLEALHERQLR